MAAWLSTTLCMGLLLIGMGACSSLEPLTATPDHRWVELHNWMRGSHIQWSPDGSRILYSEGSVLFAVDVQTGTRQTIYDQEAELAGDTTPPQIEPRMMHFDMSPDGSRVAFSICLDVEVLEDGSAFCADDFEILTANVGGSDVRRLTRNDHFDNFPAWAPGGGSVAYISSKAPVGENYDYFDPDTWGVTGRLMIQRVADGRKRGLPRAIGSGVAPHPPQWSPDGKRIAFVVYEDHEYVSLGLEVDQFFLGDVVRRRAVYTVDADGGNLTRISDAFSDPSWSPDGRRLALAVPISERELGAQIATFAADGSDFRSVTGVEGVPPHVNSGLWVWTARPLWMGKVHWSPDGSRLLYSKPEDYSSDRAKEEDRCWVCVATVEGGNVTEVAPFRTVLRRPDDTHSTQLDGRRVPDLLAWSPDGSRIAVKAQVQSRLWTDDLNLLLLYTIDREGNDPRIVVPEGEAGQSQAEVIASCANGVAVTNPGANAGLVEDCRLLLRSRYVLGGQALNYWTPHRPITEWGPPSTPWVGLHGNPPRVWSITIEGFVEDVRPNKPLAGQIPLELGGLTLLEVLNLHLNLLTGEIPPELSRLANLKTLVLSANLLMGEIPPELGKLTNLETLSLAANDLTGSIPPELGKLTNLEVLALTGNDLTGSIPPEIGNLVNLKVLRLSGTGIGGQLPPELGKLENLHRVNLERANFSGCVPTVLDEIWVEATGLPRCTS